MNPEILFLITDGDRYVHSVEEHRVRWRNRFSDVPPCHTADDARLLLLEASDPDAEDYSPALVIRPVSKRLYRLATADCA